MSKKLTLTAGRTTKEAFDEFIAEKYSRGIKAKTIETYSFHFHSISKYLCVETNIDELSKKDLQDMIASMRQADVLSSSSINSYTRTLKSFLSWCNAQGYTDVNIDLYKAEESLKDTYTTEELKLLLQKPKFKETTFCEYRNWVIVNMLIDCGCRAATLRNILIKDVNLDSNLIYYRHNKNGKIQIVPLSMTMKNILKEYMRLRKGESADYLFPSEYDEQMTENGLRQAIAYYNKSRGVSKTSIHLFRHTFAERFIQSGGNPFDLQRILGHSTLTMTKHYCNMYDNSVTANFNEISPLNNLQEKKKFKRIS